MKKIVTLIIAFSAAFLFADELKITVMDKDLDFPLEGAKVSLDSDPKITEIADEDGNAVLSIPDSVSSGTIKAKFPGYRDESVNFSSSDESVTIYMSIADVIEGKELVVNRAAPEKKEEKIGVATVMSKEQMHTTANIGIAEDCMASIRTLPGVSFSGAWGSEPSIRGGDPREAACLLDGMYTIFPWHWGGGVSIFNPSMTDTIKLSNGVFSAKYGRASAGLLEATTITPDYENFHLNAGFSTTCADAFAQVPFGKDVGGLLLGAHVSYLDPVVWAFKKMNVSALDSIKRAPYIRDLFLKTNLTPTPELFVSVIGFFGSDGLEMNQTEEKDGLKTKAIMDYDIYQALGGINVKYLANDKLLFHGNVAYNGMFEDMDMNVTESGSIKYNDEFVNKYGSEFPGVKNGGSYNIPELKSQMTEKIDNHLVSGRLESEIELNERNHLCVGVEETFSTAKTTEKQDGWTDIEINGKNLFRHVDFSSVSDGNCIYDHAAFLCWTFGNDNDLIQSELGVRGEFISLKNSSDDFTLNFIPDVCPRASFTVTPWRNIGEFEKISFTAGSGLFVSIPRETMILSKDMEIGSSDMHSNRAIFSVLGTNVDLESGWNFKLESYYRYYLSRIYAYSYTDESSNYQNVKFSADSNGKGHVFGIDSMIEKKAGGAWDGYLSYSFSWARMKNPAGIKSGVYAPNSMYGDPLDEWYYPRYHRFHTLNLVSNWHFRKNWTFTVKGTLATGAPKDKVGDVGCYAARMDDGTVIQRYTRSSFYSDTLRNQISCPIDLRIAYEWKSNNDKTSWEFYFALQDVFVNLYSPKGDKSFNKYTGEMSDVAESADFNMGIPIPSVGMKVKF